MELEVWKKYDAARTAGRKGEARRRLNALVTANERLVFTFVDRLLKRDGSEGIDREDAYQCGRIGLMLAIEKYDPTLGGLATFARGWIRHELQRGSLLEQTIYRPRSSAMPGDVARVFDRIRATENRAATVEDFADREAGPVTQDDLDRWLAPPIVRSLDEPSADAGGGVEYDLHEVLPGPDELHPDALAEDREFFGETLPAMLETMPDAARTATMAALRSEASDHRDEQHQSGRPPLPATLADMSSAAEYATAYHASTARGAVTAPRAPGRPRVHLTPEAKKEAQRAAVLRCRARKAAAAAPS